MKRKEWFVIYPIAARHRAVVVRILYKWKAWLYRCELFVV